MILNRHLVLDRFLAGCSGGGGDDYLRGHRNGNQTAHGGKGITADDRRIRRGGRIDQFKFLAFGQTKGDARIDVKDSGIGIAAEDIPLATDRFGQLAGDPMSNPIGGMGLGLPLSISLAELIGARVDINSQKGAGTRVTLIFPADKLLRPGRMAG